MRPKPTPENHHALHVPKVDWERLTPSEWTWPFCKLGYSDPNDIWGSLYEKFNCINFGIQDPYAWHSDVCEIGWKSDSKEEFEAALLKRRDERFNEIRANWEKARGQLTANPPIWNSPPTGPDRPWATFVRFGRHFTFDTVVGHFGNYMVDDPRQLYREMNAKSRKEAAEASSSSCSQPREQPGQSQQLPLNSGPPSTSPSSHLPPSPSRNQPPLQAPAPAPAPTPAKKGRKTRVTRVGKGAAARSKVEKPVQKQHDSKIPPREGVRRSARLQGRERRRGG
ncbi:hypothetical protein RRF57_010754 [Xylaria bambusicola]|uniref:Uncharacterized protein n=1 Tax=Xylaria bambusicola TaxID=326684 RepID=A0AAN7Z8X6_9PEZI